LAIVCKQNSAGGTEYDGRKCAEARQLVDVAFRSYPELARKEEKFLHTQLESINLQQAEKDYKIAEIYRRTGSLPSAYFCYQIVRLRYPNTKYATMATDRMINLQAKLEKEKGKKVPLPPAPGDGPAPAPTPGRETAPQPRPLVPGEPLYRPEMGPPP